MPPSFSERAETPSSRPSSASSASSSSSNSQRDSLNDSSDSLSYPNESGLQQFLRLRRERWKIRLGSLKINRRLLQTTLNAWKGYKDDLPKPTAEERESVRIAALEESERQRRAIQLPKPYHGPNSLHSSYIIEPHPVQWRSVTWLDLVSDGLAKSSLPPYNVNIQDPNPLPAQYPPSLFDTYKLTIDKGHATYFRQLLQYMEETPSTLPNRVASYGLLSGWPPIVSVLLEFGISPNSEAAMGYTRSTSSSNPSMKGNTFMHCAAYSGDVVLLRQLLSYGGSLTCRNEIGRTPLHLAAYTMDEASFLRCKPSEHPILVLLEAGRGGRIIDVNARDKMGMTALHLACLSRDAKGIRFLVGEGADCLIEGGARGQRRFCFELINIKLRGGADLPKFKSSLLSNKSGSEKASSRRKTKGGRKSKREKLSPPVQIASPGSLALAALSSSIEKSPSPSSYRLMHARAASRLMFRRVLSSFATICPLCHRRITTCNHNRDGKYAYWNMTHGYTARDCDIEKGARRKGLRSFGAPIPEGFSSPWNGPLYGAPDIVEQIMRREIPPTAEMGKPTPMEMSVFEGQVDAIGNLPWEQMMPAKDVERRKRSMREIERGKKDKPWHQLTFAERKAEIKKRALLREQMKVGRTFDDSSDEDDDDEDGDDPGARARGGMSRKVSVLAPLRNPRNPYERHRKVGDADGAGGHGKDKLPSLVTKRRERKSNSWEEGNQYQPKEVDKSRKSRSSRDFRNSQNFRGSRQSRGFRKSAKEMFLTEEQRKARAQRNWTALRNKLKPASRELLRQQVMRNPTNLDNVVRLGIACVDTGPHSSPFLSRMAVLLLEKAYACGFDPANADGGAGFFWKKYAQAHTVCWDCGGGSVNQLDDAVSKANAIGRERVHLERAIEGWEQALRYMANATDVNCWASAALTSQRLGDYRGAANILGTVITSFPDNKSAAMNSVTVSAILAELKQYEQAVAYMHNAMAKGAPEPLRNLHLMFFMSRLYQRWHEAFSSMDPAAVEDPDDLVTPPPLNVEQQAKAGFARCYEFEAETGGMMFKTEWAGLGAKGWVDSYATWRKFGDAASAAGQRVLAADLYREGLRREPPKPPRAKLYAFVSRALIRAGKSKEALALAEKAAKVASKDKFMPKEEAKTYENSWEKLKYPTKYFEIELNLDVLSILDRYASAIPSSAVLRQIETAAVAAEKDRERRETRLTLLKSSKRTRGGRPARSTAHWTALRDRLKGAARAYYQMQLLNAPKHAISGNMLAVMGKLCVDTGPNRSVELDRCAAIVLQKAADSGFTGDPDVPNSGADFYLNLARAHYRLWLRDGIRAERIHLIRSAWSWEKALVHVKVACDVGCWRESAHVSTCLGDYKRAAQTLGVLVRSFPRYPHIASVQLDAAILLYQLKQFEQAVAYCANSTKNRRLQNAFNHMDVIFFMSQIYLKWADLADKEWLARDPTIEGEDESTANTSISSLTTDKKRKERKTERKGNDEEGEEGDESDGDGEDDNGSDASSVDPTLSPLGNDRRKVANLALEKVFTAKVESKEIDEEEVNFDEWLEDPATYRDFAQRAYDSSKYLLAVDYFQKAIKIRIEDVPNEDSDTESSPKRGYGGKGKASVATEEDTRESSSEDDSSGGSESDSEEEAEPVELAQLWFGLAKSHCRCGQMNFAVRACKQALLQPESEATGKARSLLENWEELSNFGSRFDDEVNMPLASIFDAYLKKSDKVLALKIEEEELDRNRVGSVEGDVVTKYRQGFKDSKDPRVKNIHTLEDVQAHVESRRKWRVLREGIRGLARESLRANIIDGFASHVGKPESECSEELIIDIARMGHSCAAEVDGPNATNNMNLAACVLLARAHDLGYLNLLNSNYDSDYAAHLEGRFWRARARSHWRLYNKQGRGSGNGEIMHLNYCLVAWDEAMKHLSTTANPRTWYEYALANVCHGKYDVAAECFGTILKNFKSYNSGSIAVMSSSLFKALGQYEQSIAYMFSAVSSGAEAPYDSVDLAFLMARCHEEKALSEGGVARVGDGEQPSQSYQIAMRAYETVFDQLKQLEEESADGPKNGNDDDNANVSKNDENGTDDKQAKPKHKNMRMANFNTVAEWLEDYRTWVHFGDICSSADHDVLATDLYEQSMQRLNQVEVHIDKPRVGMKLAKSLRRCGQHQRAIDALTAVMNNLNMNNNIIRGGGKEDDNEDGKKRITKLTALRKNWTGGEGKKQGRRGGRQSLNADGTLVYRKAVDLPVLLVLEKFVGEPVQREEDLELKELRNLAVRKAKEGKWKFLRRRLKESARIEYAKEYMGVLRDKENTYGMKKRIMKGVVEDMEMMEIQKETGRGGIASPQRRISSLSPKDVESRDEILVGMNMLVKLGVLCHDSSSESGPMHRCAANLLQRAVDFGHKGDGHFYTKLARSHFRAYISGGAKGDRDHLKLSNKAWDKAFEHIEVASNVECWLDASNVRIHCGQFDRAAQTLGVLVRSFPHYPNLNSVSITSSSLLQKLGNFEQARAYMYDAMSRGAPAPFTQLDLTFYMAHIYEQWGKKESDLNHLATATKAFKAVYASLKKTNSPLVFESDGANTTIEKGFNVFLESAVTWRWFGEKACLGSNFILGADMYQNALERDNTLASNNLRSILYFGLAKCKAKYGDMSGASSDLLDALSGTDDYDQTNALKAKDTGQMQVILEAWENPSSRFHEEMNLSVPKLLAGYALISPSAATTPIGTPRTARGDDVTPRRSVAPSPRSAGAPGQGDRPLVVETKTTKLWRKLRKQVKASAITKLVEQIATCGSVEVNKIAAKIAFLLITDNSQLSAAIFQNLYERKYRGEKGEDEGVFLSRLAIANTNSWFLSGGGGVTRMHLKRAKAAWKEALTHLSVVSDPNSWAQFVAVNTAMGDWEMSANSLGTLIRSFPQIDSGALAVIALEASSLLAELKQFEQACAYLYDSIEKGAPHPLNDLDMSFFMARLHERWGGGAKVEKAYQEQVAMMTATKGKSISIVEPMFDDETGEAFPTVGSEECEMLKSKRDAANTAYDRVFGHLKQHVGSNNGIRTMNVENHSDLKGWLNDSKTWSMYAELANIASINVLARDLYCVASSLDEENVNILGLFAKSQRQVGDDRGAIASLSRAITLLQMRCRKKQGNDGGPNEKDFELLRTYESWIKLWDEEENGDNLDEAKDDLFSERVKMNVKTLIKTSVEISTGEVLEKVGEGDYGGDIDLDDLSLEDLSVNNSDFGKTMLVAPGGQLVRQKKPKLLEWQVKKRDKFRCMIFEIVRIGLRRFALNEVIRKTKDDGQVILDEMIPKDPRLTPDVFENGLSCAVIGSLCVTVSRNNITKLGLLLLERARVYFKFDGVEDYVEKFESEAEGKKKLTASEKLQKDYNSTVLGSYRFCVTKARYLRTIAVGHSYLADKNYKETAGVEKPKDGAKKKEVCMDIGSKFHAFSAVKAWQDALQCEENVIGVENWVELGKAQIRVGEYEKAMETFSTVMETREANGGSTLGEICVILAGLYVKLGGVSNVKKAEEMIKRAMASFETDSNADDDNDDNISLEEGLKTTVRERHVASGLGKMELAFLCAFIMEGAENIGREETKMLLLKKRAKEDKLMENDFKKRGHEEKYLTSKKRLDLLAKRKEEDEGEGGINAIRMSAALYEAVFEEFNKDVEMKHNESNATVEGYLRDINTWLYYAKKCDAADQNIFSSLLYDRAIKFAYINIDDFEKRVRDEEEALKSIDEDDEKELTQEQVKRKRTIEMERGNLEKTARKMKHFICRRMATSLARGGDFSAALRAAKSINNSWLVDKLSDVEHETEKILFARLTDEESSANLIKKFKVLKAAVHTMRCVKKKVKEEYVEQRKIMIRKRHWASLKKGVRPAARALAIQQALFEPEDKAKLALLGVLCSSDSSSGGEKIERCACLLMQAAADMGYEGNGNFWKKLAQCHLRLWQGSSRGRGGGGGERGHLLHADAAWTKALQHLDIAMDVNCWLNAAETKLCLGRYEGAAKALGTLMSTLGSGVFESKLPEIPQVVLTVTELFFELEKYDQAEAYLYDCMTRGAPGALTNVDLLFFMARIHAKWGEKLLRDNFDGGDGSGGGGGGGGGAADTIALASSHRETADAAYGRVFRQCVELGENVMGVTAACVTADDWLSSYGPWQAFGERAEISRHYLLAGELYREGLNRDEFASKTNSKAWFSLAKVLRRCGRLDESLGAARRAVEIFSEKGRGGERDSNMDLAIKAWETDGLGEFGAGGFQKELGSGSISVWVDMYLGAEGELMEGSVGNGGGGGVSLPNSKPVSVEKRRFDWYSGFEEEEEEEGGGARGGRRGREKGRRWQG